MQGIFRKNLKKEKKHDRRLLHGVASMITILLVLMAACLIVLIYSKKIKDQFFQERSKNLLNVSSKISDMMNSIITDVWSCMDTIEYVVSDRENIKEDEMDKWLMQVQKYICIRRGEDNRDVLLLFDENSRYYMATDESYYTGNWHMLEHFTDLKGNDNIYATTLPYIGESENYIMLLRRIEEGALLSDSGIRIKYIAICINTNDFKDSFQVEGFDRQNFFYILSKDGHRLFRYEQGDSFIDVFNVFNVLEDCEILEGNTINQIEENLNKKQDSCCEFLYEGKRYYVSSTSLDFRDWFILMFVPTEVLASNYDSFLKTTFSFSTLIAILAVILFVSIISIFILSRLEGKMARQQKEANERLAEAALIASNANAAKTEFLSNMSHDIRTPINGIMGMVAIGLRQNDNPEKTVDCLNKINSASNHLLSLINDILDMSRIERGKIELTNSNMNIKNTVDECVSIIQGQIKKGGQDLIVSMEDVQHEELFGDDLHFRQILINILSNAVKFTPEGGKIWFRIREKEVQGAQAIFMFEIEDTGIGMKPEFIKDIFKPFCQEANTSRTNYEGTGLGMAITKNIVDLMGGSIRVDSKYHEGSIFTVELPFYINHIRNTQVIKSTASERIEGIKVLLVDDNELNLEVAKELLEEEGCIVTTAYNGKEAVELFSNNPFGSFDVIIMDIMMPIMDGYEATKSIRQLKSVDATNIPIIAMTANAFSDDVKKSYEVGMDAHISKPVDISTIMNTIHQILNKRR